MCMYAKFEDRQFVYIINDIYSIYVQMQYVYIENGYIYIERDTCIYCMYTGSMNIVLY